MSKNFDQLPAASALTGNETLPVNQAGVTRFSTINAIIAFMGTAYDALGAAATAISNHLSAYVHGDIAHSNRTALDQVSGTNTGDQNLSGYAALTGGLFTGPVKVSYDPATLNGYSDPPPATQAPNALATKYYVDCKTLQGLTGYAKGAWTPVDNSYSSLDITGTNCEFVQIGDMMFLTGAITIPTNSSTNVLQIGGAPKAPKYEQVGTTDTPSLTYGGIRIQPSGNIMLYNVPGSTPKINSALSGLSIKFNIAYRVAGS